MRARLIITFSFLILFINWAHLSIIRNTKDARVYLERFGYLDETGDNQRGGGGTGDRIGDHNPNNKTRKKFKNVLQRFQQYTGLSPTGKFDNDTLVMMNKPRCGMAERMGLTENKHMNRRLLSHRIPPKRRWNRSRIYYRIEKFPGIFGSGIGSSTVRRELKRAFRLWENAANIRCIELRHDSNRMAEIDISFEFRNHGDGTDFGDESVGNAVAHAFYPNPRHRFEGDIHFDNEREWTAHNISGINLYQVAAHEIGHALGLDHSVIRESVMHMIVHDVIDADFKLHEDDIKGIQNLYGRRQPRSGGWSRYREHQQQMRSRFREQAQTTESASSSSSSRTGNENPISFPTDKPEAAKATIKEQTIQNDSETETPFESSLSSFWECFGLSYEPNSKKNATDCYTRNVLNLIYSLKI